MQSMIQILLQLVTFTFEPIMRTFEFMVQTLDFMVAIVDDIFQLAVFDLHQWYCFGVVVEDVVELGFVLPGVGLFYEFDLTIFFYL